MLTDTFLFRKPRRVAALLLALYAGLSCVGGVLVCWYDYRHLHAEGRRQAAQAVHLLHDHLLVVLERHSGQHQDIAQRWADSNRTTLQTWLTSRLPHAPAKTMVLDQDGAVLWRSPDLNDRIANFSADSLEFPCSAPNCAQETVGTAGGQNAFGHLVGQKWWDSLVEVAHSRLRSLSGSKMVIGPLVSLKGGQSLFPLLSAVPAANGSVKGYILTLIDNQTSAPLLAHLETRLPTQLGVDTLDTIPVMRTATSDGHDTANAILAADFLQKKHPGQIDLVQADPQRRAYHAYRYFTDFPLLAWVTIDLQDEWHGFVWRASVIFGALLAGQLILAAILYILFQEMRNDQLKNRTLEDLNRNLARSNADLEQFAYIASHDLKEPLRNISSYVQLLQRRYEGRLDDDADAFISYTVEGVRRLQTIINELLAYSRIGTGHLKLTTIQVGILVGNALSNLKGTIAEAQAAIEVKGTLPVIAVDAPQITSLFQNLIGNAIKYRVPHIRPLVEIGYADRGQEWAFYVRDNGIGIAPEYQQQIFGLFKRLHTREQYGGTGIGLSVCQRVVERHGGHIWVESSPGMGSCFWFTLPKQSPSLHS